MPETAFGGDTTKMSSYELQHRFSRIAGEVAHLLESPRPDARLRSIRWSDISFALDKPRFGVEEVVDSGGFPVLLVAEALRAVPSYLLNWVLWREAVLQTLCRSVRLVPEAADLGLYAGIKYGRVDVHERERLYHIWQSVSPTRSYQFYSYSPTTGFSSFDRVTEGRFLQEAIQWLNATFKEVQGSLSSLTLTSALEKWMLEFNRPLNPQELRVLEVLSNQPSISQNELANHVGLSQASVSRILKQLADSHLVRLYGEVNLPVIGLSRVGTTFSFPRITTSFALRKILEEIRYGYGLAEFDNALHCGFTVPSRRLARLRRWLRELADAFDLPLPDLRFVEELAYHRNFDSYDCRGRGWPLDYEPILANVSRLIRGEWSRLLPPLRRVRYSEWSMSTQIRLQPEDFIYLQRAVDAFLLTNRVSSTQAREARLAGFTEGEHMSYRRRLRFLEQMRLLLPTLGLGVFHIGLDALVDVLLEGPYHDTIKVLSALQLMPHIDAVIYDDGSASAALLVPKQSAVAVRTSLQDSLSECGVSAVTAVKPIWQAYGRSLSSTLDPHNYDFERGDWRWTKDTLPEIHPPSV